MFLPYLFKIVFLSFLVKKSGSKTDKKDKKKKAKDKEGKTSKKSTTTANPFKDGDSEKKKVSGLYESIDAVPTKSVDKKKKEKKKKLKTKEVTTTGGEVKKPDQKSSTKKVEKPPNDVAKISSTKPVSSTVQAKEEVRKKNEPSQKSEKSKDVRNLEKVRKPEPKRNEVETSKNVPKSKIVAEKMRRSESRDSISDVEMPTKENAEKPSNRARKPDIEKRRRSESLDGQRKDVQRPISAEHRSKDRRGSSRSRSRPDRSRSPMASTVHRTQSNYQRRSPECRGSQSLFVIWTLNVFLLLPSSSLVSSVLLFEIID